MNHLLSHFPANKAQVKYHDSTENWLLQLCDCNCPWTRTRIAKWHVDILLLNLAPISMSMSRNSRLLQVFAAHVILLGSHPQVTVRRGSRKKQTKNIGDHSTGVASASFDFTLNCLNFSSFFFYLPNIWSILDLL